jgi:hypothetical protein
MIIVDVFVPGTPKTKGSLDITRRGYVTENVAGSVRWRCLVAERVRAWRTAQRFDVPSSGPVRVDLTCWLPVPAWVGDDDMTTYLAATWVNSGDVDKLARNVLDALSVAPVSASTTDRKKYAGAYVDDRLVQTLVVRKFGTRSEHAAGVRVFVSEFTERNLQEAHATLGEN